MFSVYADVLKDGKPYKHEVKALGIIWNRYPNYTAANTIHVDDLARNFAMNPSNGLRVHAYNSSKRAAGGDRELLFVTRYLLQLALVPDFTKLDHKNSPVARSLFRPAQKIPSRRVRIAKDRVSDTASG